MSVEKYVSTKDAYEMFKSSRFKRIRHYSRNDVIRLCNMGFLEYVKTGKQSSYSISVESIEKLMETMDGYPNTKK